MDSNSETNKIDLEKYLKSLGFNENEKYDIPKTWWEFNEASIKAHQEEMKKMDSKFKN